MRALLVTTLILAGCEAKIAPTVKSGAPVPKPDGVKGAQQQPDSGQTPAGGGDAPVTRAGETTVPATTAPAPVEFTNGLGNDRTVFQTRSVVTITLSSDIVPPGSSFSLLNLTSGNTLIENQSVTLPGMGLKLDEPGYGVRLSQGYDVTLRLYPSSEAMTGRFKYGGNDLKLLVDGEAPKYALRTIELADFDMQGIQAITTDETSEGGLELWINPVTSPAVTRASSLTVGMENQLND
jgi:hypothetical protein